MTKKIEQQMITAIRTCRNYRHGNTRVAIEGDAASVYLHDNCIARQLQDGSFLFNLCGWNTTTTRSRINALALAFMRGRRVISVNGTPYTTKPVPGGVERVEVPNVGWF